MVSSERFLFWEKATEIQSYPLLMDEENTLTGASLNAYRKEWDQILESLNPGKDVWSLGVPAGIPPTYFYFFYVWAFCHQVPMVSLESSTEKVMVLCIGDTYYEIPCSLSYLPLFVKEVRKQKKGNLISMPEEFPTSWAEIETFKEQGNYLMIPAQINLTKNGGQRILYAFFHRMVLWGKREAPPRKPGLLVYTME